MVDFKKLLGKIEITKPKNPIEIFEDLDKESGKEYLRPPQRSVLEEWHEKLRAQKDVIVKLHTGQGKTLIGLLMLQSSLNEGKGPVVYICPNNYLVDQIVEQADSFGIKTTEFSDTKPPQEFLNSDAILVTNCKKLFNGKSVFGVRGSGKDPIQLGAVVIDDAHRCLDIMRESFSIIVEREGENGDNPLYKELLALFEDTLRRQAPGTCADISDGVSCLMAVPFWSWYDKREEVLKILSKHRKSDELLFVWDLMKDHIDECVCIFSGKKLEITPRLLPVDRIPSFSEAERRIFLSATLTEDAFLVRDIGIAPESVINPLSSGDVKYSGERLILLPSLVDTALQRTALISWVQGLATKNGDFGIVAIAPSFWHAESWETYGAKVTNVRKLYKEIDELKVNVKRRKAKYVLVLVNEYDGVDLPDSTCRVLVLDSLPSYRTLMDSYLQEMRPSSGTIRRQLAQRVEQGMGRAIRGSSDWCIVMIVGNDITNFLSEKSKRAFLSNEARLQIGIGEELVEQMKSEGGQLTTIASLIGQCLRRDETWKEYYKNRMSKLTPDEPQDEHLARVISERNAEILYRQRQFKKASDTLNDAIGSADVKDRGWLLQLMATYLYPIDRRQSMDKQLRAHVENPNLFRPESGITYSKLISTGTRTSRILEWIRQHESNSSVILEVNGIMEKLSWGTSPSELFEQGMCELGRVLGFISDRPEKKTGEGPDNLWNIHGKTHWIIECKSQVKGSRTEISKTEAGQLHISIGWFQKHHEKEEGLPIFVHPAKKLASGTYINKPFWVLTMNGLKKMRTNTANLYKSLGKIPFDNLSENSIAQELREHHLETDGLMKEYLQRGEK